MTLAIMAGMYPFLDKVNWYSYATMAIEAGWASKASGKCMVSGAYCRGWSERCSY